MTLPAIDEAVFNREEPLLRRIVQVTRGLGDGEKAAMLLRAVEFGSNTVLTAQTKRRRSEAKKLAAADEFQALIESFNLIGAAAIFRPKSARAGDFLINYSRGEWAERILRQGLVETGRYDLVSYGPSTPPMPGESDYLRKIGIFSLITALEGKRPDGLLYHSTTFAKLADEIRALANEQLSETPEDQDPRVAALIHGAAAALEVKSSVYLADRRPAGSLSVTLKEEEIEPFDNWRRKYNKPIIFAQVFFDSAYLLNYDHMKRCIVVGSIDGMAIIAEPDRKTGKKTYRFPLSRARRFADVPFPVRSTAKFMVIGGATVAPYIAYDGDAATGLNLAVLERALEDST